MRAAPLVALVVAVALSYAPVGWKGIEHEADCLPWVNGCVPEKPLREGTGRAAVPAAPGPQQGANPGAGLAPIPGGQRG